MFIATHVPIGAGFDVDGPGLAVGQMAAIAPPFTRVQTRVCQYKLARC